MASYSPHDIPPAPSNLKLAFRINANTTLTKMVPVTDPYPVTLGRLPAGLPARTDRQ